MLGGDSDRNVASLLENNNTMNSTNNNYSINNNNNNSSTKGVQSTEHQLNLNLTKVNKDKGGDDGGDGGEVEEEIVVAETERSLAAALNMARMKHTQDGRHPEIEDPFNNNDNNRASTTEKRHAADHNRTNSDRGSVSSGDGGDVDGNGDSNSNSNSGINNIVMSVNSASMLPPHIVRSPSANGNASTMNANNLTPGGRAILGKSLQNKLARVRTRPSQQQHHQHQTLSQQQQPQQQQHGGIQSLDPDSSAIQGDHSIADLSYMSDDAYGEGVESATPSMNQHGNANHAHRSSSNSNSNSTYLSRETSTSSGTPTIRPSSAKRADGRGNGGGSSSSTGGGGKVSDLSPLDTSGYDMIPSSPSPMAEKKKRPVLKKKHLAGLANFKGNDFGFDVETSSTHTTKTSSSSSSSTSSSSAVSVGASPGGHGRTNRNTRPRRTSQPKDPGSPNTQAMRRLAGKWVEVELLLRQDVKSQQDYMYVVAQAKAGLLFVKQLSLLSEATQVPLGKLCRLVLPFNNNTAVSDQAHASEALAIAEQSKERDVTMKMEQYFMGPLFLSHRRELTTMFDSDDNNSNNTSASTSMTSPIPSFDASRCISESPLDLVSAATALRKLVRVKIADENDLAQAQAAVEAVVGFHEAVQERFKVFAEDATAERDGKNEGPIHVTSEGDGDTKEQSNDSSSSSSSSTSPSSPPPLVAPTKSNVTKEFFFPTEGLTEYEFIQKLLTFP